MIRNVTIHIANEQPLLADLFSVPTAADTGMLCTNVRMMDGKRPVFIDSIVGTFFFPYHVVRFIEIPAGALEGHDPDEPIPGAARRDGQPDGHAAADGASEANGRLPVPVAAGNDLPEGELELEIDEDFLRRVRDI
jgi:hypothetical protein